MKRILLLLTVLFVFKTTTHAQAYEGRLDYQKTSQPAAIIELPYKQDVVEDGLKDYMSKRGYKSSSSKGFDVFRSAKFDINDADQNDLYFKIDRKSRQEKDITIITLLPAKPNQDLIARIGDSTTEPKVAAAKIFLDSLAPHIYSHNANVQVGLQLDILKKAQKNLTGLQDDQASLEKKQRNLTADQAQNKTDLLKQTQDIQNTVTSDDNVKNKAQKKLNKLLDEQDNIAKKLRKVQSDLDQNKIDQDKQTQEVAKQQQILETLKAKQTN
jgi:hypothetical protein